MKYKILIIIVLQLFCLRVSASDFIGTHDSGDPRSVIAIPVPCPALGLKSYFMSPVWAIDVQRILCDGKEVKAVPLRAQLDDMDLRIIESTSIMVYRLRLGDLVVADKFNLKVRGYTLKSYAVDVNVKVIEIWYKVRMPFSSDSETCKLTSYDYSQTNPSGKTYQ